MKKGWVVSKIGSKKAGSSPKTGQKRSGRFSKIFVKVRLFENFGHFDTKTAILSLKHLKMASFRQNLDVLGVFDGFLGPKNLIKLRKIGENRGLC